MVCSEHSEPPLEETTLQECSPNPSLLPHLKFHLLKTPFFFSTNVFGTKSYIIRACDLSSSIKLRTTPTWADTQNELNESKPLTAFFLLHKNNPTNDLRKSIHPFPPAIPQEKGKGKGVKDIATVFFQGFQEPAVHVRDCQNILWF